LAKRFDASRQSEIRKNKFSVSICAWERTAFAVLKNTPPDPYGLMYPDANFFAATKVAWSAALIVARATN
jgi:hypothetical protein